jgi:hypothetical protein
LNSGRRANVAAYAPATCGRPVVEVFTDRPEFREQRRWTAYTGAMPHLSEWHTFNPRDRKTYPKVNAPVQIRFADGKFEEGQSRMFFPQTDLLPCSSITAWRYVKGPSQS